MRLPEKARISLLFVATLLSPHVWAHTYDELTEQGIYAVFEYETSQMTRVFDGSKDLYLTVQGRDPYPRLLSRLESLYSPIYLGSLFDEKSGIHVKITVLDSDATESVTIKFTNWQWSYETTYYLELNAGNWVIERAHHKMR